MEQTKELVYKYTVERYEDGAANIVDLSEGLSLKAALQDIEDLGKIIEKQNQAKMIEDAAERAAARGAIKALELFFKSQQPTNEAEAEATVEIPTN